MNRDKKIAYQIATEVQKLGGSVYYVGGYVRDEILGRENKDIDIEVYGITPESLKGICNKIGRVDEVGVSFGVLKIHGCDIDITMPRRERATGTGHRDFKVSVDPFMCTKEAAMRRDFTMNAIMKNVLTDEIVDHYEGVADIKKKSIRHINDKSFIEDPLRVFRAAGFASRLNFVIANSTANLCKTIDVSTLPKERIYEETNKVLMKSDKPSIYFENLLNFDKIDDFFLEIASLYAIEQNYKYHPEGNAWNHTMMVLDNAAAMREDTSFPLGFMYSALLHDVGKTISTVFDEEKNRLVSVGHEITGIQEAKKALQRLTDNKQLIGYVQNMVEYHMRPFFVNFKTSYKTTNRLIDNLLSPKDLILLSFCDRIGRSKIDPDLVKWWDDRLNHYTEIIKKPEVTGNTLITLGYIPDPKFSEILKQCHQIHLAGVSKEDVIRQLPEIVKSIE